MNNRREYQTKHKLKIYNNKIKTTIYAERLIFS